MPRSMLLRTGITAAGGPRPLCGEGTRLHLEDGRTVIDASSTPRPLAIATRGWSRPLRGR